MPRVFTREQVERYHREGVLFPVPALEARLGGKPSAQQLSQTHLYFRWAYDLATHPAVLDAVEAILGPNILVWTVSIFPKHARDPGYISWHQDGTYWRLSSTQVTTAWVALTDSTVENGCMRVVKGSHARPILPHVETWAPHNLLSRGQEVQAEVREEDATDVVLRAGEMSLHHVNIIHGSNPNRTDGRRVGFAIRFITPDVSQAGERPPAVLARGRDDFHHFELLPKPPDGPIDDAIAAQAAAARRLLEALTKTPAAG